MDSSPEPKAHAGAEVFPMLTDDELDVLAADITAHGLRQPITVDAAGAVLDGRNRLEACRRAGVEPRFVTFDGDPWTYVLSANVHRRHMTTGARAMATALVLQAAGKRRNGRWARGSVPTDSSGSGSSGWAQRMAEAGQVLDRRPELGPEVVDGSIALSAAVEIAAVPDDVYKEIHRVVTKVAVMCAADEERRTGRVIRIPANIDAATEYLLSIEYFEVTLERELRYLMGLVDGSTGAAALVEQRGLDPEQITDWLAYREEFGRHATEALEALDSGSEVAAP